ncbi:hypothetical protein CW304_02075 [Bacillus sp. UFRGS-B20]|nr:hypothetical protein CW304_02075 [Bacillus sp. UFRGS-B20]
MLRASTHHFSHSADIARIYIPKGYARKIKRNTVVCNPACHITACLHNHNLLFLKLFLTYSTYSINNSAYYPLTRSS